MKIEYELSKHRFYELKHFCLQYPEWKKLYFDADGWSGKGDTTSRDGIRRGDLKTYMDMVESCARSTDVDILRFVTTEGITIPSEIRYAYRRFFWELSRKR